MRRARLVLLSLVALAVGVSPAVAARKRLSVSPAVTTPDALVHISGNAPGCQKGTTVVAISSAFPGHAYGKGTLTGSAGRGGTFSFSGHLRSPLKSGRYSITARCGGGNVGITVFLTVR